MYIKLSVPKRRINKMFGRYTASHLKMKSWITCEDKIRQMNNDHVKDCEKIKMIKYLTKIITFNILHFYWSSSILLNFKDITFSFCIDYIVYFILISFFCNSYTL